MQVAVNSPIVRGIIFVIALQVALCSGGFAQDKNEPFKTSPVGELKPPKLKAGSALLLDVRTKSVLYELNSTKPFYPASLTKVMTALLILERGNLDDMVVVTKEACSVEPSSAGLKEGEVISLRHLLYLILVKSANDACVAAAIHIAGSVSAFVRMMNERAKSLGAQYTHFCNPHGLHNDKHYSTAQDLARITIEALKHEEFRNAIATRVLEVPPTNKSKARVFKNLNKLLWEYEGADGVKTGYTIPAGKCLIATATRNGWQLLAVILKSSNQFEDAKALLDYGFSSFISIPITQKGSTVATFHIQGGVPSCVAAIPKEDFFAVLKRNEIHKLQWRIHQKPVKLPLHRGDTIGYVEFTSPSSSTHLIELASASDVMPLNDGALKRLLVSMVLLMLLIACGIGVFYLVRKPVACCSGHMQQDASLKSWRRVIKLR
ncbi:MAG: hypothetical protein RUDDFDWM_000721 [Candidatus Fervidibacterota bacterium]